MHRWLAVIFLLVYLSPAQPQEPSRPTSGQNPIGDFFSGFTVADEFGHDWAQAAFGPLTGSIPAMSPAQITAGIAVVDRQLDKAAEPENHKAKEYAANLLVEIGRRPDGPELLASQIDRLASMLQSHDPYHSLDGTAMIALLTIYRNRPDLLVPIFEVTLRAPEVEHRDGIGIAPELALALLYWVHLPGDEIVNQVAQYLRRPELADDELLYTISGIDKLPVIPDALTAELIRSLDRTNEKIKIKALIGISKGNPWAKDAARTRIEKIANDPNEIAEVRWIAAEALKGEVTETPGGGASHPPDPHESSKN